MGNTVSRVFRLGKITVGDGWVAYENRTASGRVEVNKETEERYRRLVMFGGNQQGGGGKEFVNLSGLFASTSGKSLVGSIKPEAFNTLFAMMQKAHAAGVELVFIVNGPGNNVRPDSKLKARLSVTLGNPPRPSVPTAPAGPFGAPSGPSTAPSVASAFGLPGAGQPAPAAPAAVPFGFGGQPADNPPKDPLEALLEGFSD